MEEFRKFLDELPIVLKIILALPFLDGIVYGIYRICKGTTAGIVLGVCGSFWARPFCGSWISCSSPSEDPYSNFEPCA